MKNLLIFCLIWTSIQLNAQTKPIAYKSHAGDMDFFLPDAQPEDDFGMPPPRIAKIKKLNDSTIVEYSTEWSGSNFILTDTVVNHPIFSDTTMSLEAIKSHYPKDVKFIDFNKKPKPTPVEKNPIEAEDKKTIVPVVTTKTIEKSKKRKKKRKAKLRHKKKKDIEANRAIVPIVSDTTPPNSLSGLGLLFTIVVGYLVVLLFAYLALRNKKIALIFNR